MRQSEYRKKVVEASDGELEAMLKQELKGLYDCRQQLALKQLNNPQAVGSARKNVSRILGEMSARKTKMGKVS